MAQYLFVRHKFSGAVQGINSRSNKVVVVDVVVHSKALNKLVVVVPTSMDYDYDDDDVGVDGGGPAADDQGVEDEEEDDDDVDGEENGDEDENSITGNEAAEMGKSFKRKRQVKVKEQKKKVTRKGRPKAHQTRKVRNPKKKLTSLRTDGPRMMM
jgi:hypothetical protein